MLAPVLPQDWSRAHAAHLLIRAGFGGTPAEIDALAAMHPEAAVAQFVDWDPPATEPEAPDWVGPEAQRRLRVKDVPPEQRLERGRELRREQLAQLQDLRVWWLRRMVESPRPLEEKLTLFWHGHFVSGFRKVRSAYAMYSQNACFRRHAVGDWPTLVRAAIREPAMLLYLDNAQSRAKAPNENLARELMELFTLGEGAYSEADVQAAARALTGWSVARDRFVFEHHPRQHDAGEKNLLGQTGPWDGDGVVDILTSQPATAPFMVRKLWRFFAGTEPDDALVSGLAEAWRADGLAMRPLLRRLLLCEAFYGESVMHRQIKSPVQWLVGALRSLELSPPAGAAMPGTLNQLGQELFDPPNVKGWDGGFAWITAASLLLRYNVAATLTGGRGPWRGGGVKGDSLLPVAHRNSRDQARLHLQQRVFAAPLRPTDETPIIDFVARQPEPKHWQDQQVASVVAFMMATPQYQLC